MWMRMIRSHGLTESKLRQVVDAYREKDLPAIEKAPGFLGIGLGQDLDRGAIGSITFWETKQAMLDTDPLSADARSRAIPMYETKDPMSVECFEVAYAHVLEPLAGGEHAWMRFVRFRDLSAEAIDIAVGSYRDDAERHIRETHGVEGIAIAADRDNGTVAVVSGWKSRASLKAAERLSEQTRARAASSAHSSPPLVDSYEVTIASRLERVTELSIS